MPARSPRPFLAAILLLALAAAVPPASAQVPREGVEHPEMFAERRAEFVRRLESGVAVFHAKPVMNRNDDVDYPYRQDSDFYYLTGFEEPEAVAVLKAGGDGPSYTLFVRPRNADPFDSEGEIWAGHRYGSEGARDVFKPGAAYVLDSLPAVMPRLLEGAPRVLYSSGGDLAFGHRLRGWARSAGVAVPEPAPRAEGDLVPDLAEAAEAFESALPVLHEMRLIKTAEEIERIQRAVDITGEAHRASMRASTPGLYEYDLEALQYYVYRTLGSERWGFPSINGSGPNSVTLHYVENDRRIEDGDVIVMDIGAEYAMYTADVTRTIPANGRFTPEQRAVYQIIVDAQDAAMELMRPGHTLGESTARAAQVVTEGLVELGLLKGTVEENLSSGAYRRFYMHGLSHWIGLDVHDVGSYTEPDGSAREFQPGMVLSNEPGIYIREGTEGVEPRWWNIGVRLENDVLVTDGDPVDLTANIPRRVEDVEAEMAKPPISIETGKPAPEVLRLGESAGSSSEAAANGAGGNGADGTATDPKGPGTVRPTDRGKPKAPARPREGSARDELR
ncbi:MAG: aminopeptidase P N-terminal domain-containing protein [Gemmatimonadales bacterium]|nr:aminopeptidase P N-terminal domain-containing protein [Gemmatimonadales bacterium]